MLYLFWRVLEFVHPRSDIEVCVCVCMCVFVCAGSGPCSRAGQIAPNFPFGGTARMLVSERTRPAMLCLTAACLPSSQDKVVPEDTEFLDLLRRSAKRRQPAKARVDHKPV
jgi:hypothetical protein